MAEALVRPVDAAESLAVQRPEPAAGRSPLRAAGPLSSSDTRVHGDYGTLPLLGDALLADASVIPRLEPLLQHPVPEVREQTPSTIEWVED